MIGIQPLEEVMARGQSTIGSGTFTDIDLTVFDSCHLQMEQTRTYCFHEDRKFDLMTLLAVYWPVLYHSGSADAGFQIFLFHNAPLLQQCFALQGMD